MATLTSVANLLTLGVVTYHIAFIAGWIAIGRRHEQG